MCCRIDPFAVTNLVLCLIVFLAGCGAYAKTKNRSLFHIGVAFGLFAVSHFITVMGLERKQAVAVILIRIFGYVIVALSLDQMAKEK